MNKHNIKYWFDEQKKAICAEWSDLSLDDDDRYKTGIIISAETPAESFEDRLAMKTINTIMVEKYDKWIEETRK